MTTTEKVNTQEVERKFSYNTGKRKTDVSYTPSNTELLLERMCTDFGTDLESAQLYRGLGMILTRFSGSTNGRDEDPRILRFQHSRFHPLREFNEDNQRMVRLLKNNGEIGRRSKAEVRKYIRELLESEKYNPVTALIDSRHIPGFPVKRFREIVYTGIFDKTDEGEKFKKPYSIHEGGNWWQNDTPKALVFLTYKRNPIFFENDSPVATEDEDRLVIELPKQKQAFEKGVQDIFRRKNKESLIREFNTSTSMCLEQEFKVSLEAPEEEIFDFMKKFIEISLENRLG